MKAFPQEVNPLFSSFLTLYLIIFLYLPPFFLTLFFSPVFISAAALLLSILRLGRASTKPQENEPPHPDPVSTTRVSFVEWDVGAPLEVIQEACCEGEEHEEEHHAGDLLQRYPSLSQYYPETDSDSDSGSDSDSCSSNDGDFRRSDCSPGFRWARGEFEEEKYGLIEIQLDGDCGKRKVVEDFELQTEEDYFIEIDIAPANSGDR